MRGLLSTGLLVLTAAATPAGAQTRIHDSNLHGWFVYSGDHPVNDRWGIHLEAQWRRHDFLPRPQQFMPRVAVNYRLTERLSLSTGYAYIATSRYGDYPVAAAFPEHRMYQQVQVQHRLERLDFQHRFRLEQRWLQQKGIDDLWRYQNRFRYMGRATLPLAGRWYLAASDEIFLNLPPMKTARAYDQNRAFVGIGRKWGRYTRVEAGYLQQTLLQRNARVLELNHTIQVNVFSVLPFRRRP